MKDDTISRKAAIDALDRFSLGETDAVKLAFRMGDYLKRLPAAEQWIPMSEREPEYGNYIITFRKKDDPKDERDVTIDYYASYGWDDDGFTYETLAWMPLPEPYKGDE